MSLIDEHGIDRLQALGQNRSKNQPQETCIVYTSTSIHPAFAPGDVLRLKVQNNLVPSGLISVFVEVALGY